MLVMRAVRSIHNLPLYVLSQRTGISPGRLSLIERELVHATDEERGKIARCLRVKARVLFRSATLATLDESLCEEETTHVVR
jgi:transcriptional regulator with XRE-family HTH domain